MYTVVFSMEAFCGEGKVALISVYFFFCNLNSFSYSLPHPDKRRINLNQDKISFDAIHKFKFYIRFSFLLLTIQCSSWYMFFGLNNTLVIKNSELTSISSVGEICISLNTEYVDLSWELGLLAIPFLFMLNWSGYSVLLSVRCIHCSFHLPFC